MLESFLALTLLHSGVSAEGYDRIQFGMTRPEVVKILGEHSLGKRDPDPASKFDFWFTSMSWEIKRDSEIWRSAFATIRVRFDAQGVVTGKMAELPPRKDQHFHP